MIENGELLKLFVTLPFSINFKCQIEYQGPVEMSLNFKADPCFLICGLDCFYTGNAKNYGTCQGPVVQNTG
jgi:hypothetical protein